MYTRVEVVKHSFAGSKENIVLWIKNIECVGQGTFGKVYKSFIVKGIDLDMNRAEVTAVKKVLQKSRNDLQRELILLQKLDHPNILSLKYYYYSVDNDLNYLNMILDFVPNNLHNLYHNYLSVDHHIPRMFIKLIIFQLLRGLAYLHFKGICHRDIKPLNLLVEAPKHVLKIGDFGSAKELNKNEPNLTYICSRFYRAPELVFGSTSYSFDIDIWSTGCVLAELMLGRPMFIANSSIDLICEICKVLGTPTKEDIGEINSAFCKYDFPLIPKADFSKIFLNITDVSLLQLLSEILVFTPSKRLHAKDALFHRSFDEMFQVASTINTAEGYTNIPDFVNFTIEELKYCPKYAELKTTYENKFPY